MVVSYEMTDKQSQQRRRDDGANRSVADRNAMEEDRALAPETTQASRARIAQQIALAFHIQIDKDVVRRILAQY